MLSWRFWLTHRYFVEVSWSLDKSLGGGGFWDILEVWLPCSWVFSFQIPIARFRLRTFLISDSHMINIFVVTLINTCRIPRSILEYTGDGLIMGRKRNIYGILVLWYIRGWDTWYNLAHKKEELVLVLKTLPPINNRTALSY